MSLGGAGWRILMGGGVVFPLALCLCGECLVMMLGLIVVGLVCFVVGFQVCALRIFMLVFLIDPDRLFVICGVPWLPWLQRLPWLVLRIVRLFGPS